MVLRVRGLILLRCPREAYQDVKVDESSCGELHTAMVRCTTSAPQASLDSAYGVGFVWRRTHSILSTVSDDPNHMVPGTNLENIACQGRQMVQCQESATVVLGTETLKTLDAGKFSSSFQIWCNARLLKYNLLPPSSHVCIHVHCITLVAFINHITFSSGWAFHH
jgi:hypothetical protein